MIDYGLLMMIYKPSKLIYSSVHIDRVYHFIRDHFHEYHYIRISVLTDPEKSPCMLILLEHAFVSLSPTIYEPHHVQLINHVNNYVYADWGAFFGP